MGKGNTITFSAPSRMSDALFMIGCLCCALPILLPQYPPMVDLPQHAAQITAIIGVLDGGWKYANLFEITYLTPYWLGYAVALLLQPLVGAVWAIKVVLALTAVAFPLSAWLLCRSVGVDPKLRWLLLPLPFSFAYEWGFVNFLAAAPIGFVFLAIMVGGGSCSRGGVLLRVVLAHVLFFAHVLTAAFVCAVCALILVRPWEGVGEWLRRCMPMLSLVPVTVAYVLLSLMQAEGVNTPIVWHHGSERVLEVLESFSPAPWNSTRSILSLIAIVAPFFFGYRWSSDPFRWVPFLLWVILMLWAPHALMGTGFTYQRFDFFGLPLYLLTFDYGKRHSMPSVNRPGLMQAGLAVLMFASLASQVSRSLAFEREHQGYNEIIAKAEPGRRVLIMSVDRYGIHSRAPVYMHFPSWYQAETAGLVDLSFAAMYSIIKYKDQAAYPVQPGFEWQPLSFNWERHRGENYSYFVIRSFRDPTYWLQHRSGCRVRLVGRAGEWWLFARNNVAGECELPD